VPLITGELVELAAARLRDGGWRYTPRQLYYASCAAAEPPPRATRAAASGVMGLGALLALIGLIFIGIPYAFAALVALGLVLLIAGALLRAQRAPQTGRVLAMSYPDFLGAFATAPREGMIDVEAMDRGARDAGAAVAIVCDSHETAAMVRANAHGVTIADADVVVSPVAEDARFAAVILLHDASPAGCAMHAELEARSSAVVEAGLRPRDVMHANTQVIEGAPARVGEAATRGLEDEEVDWLRSGRRVELAVLTPPAALDLVVRAYAEVQRKPRARTASARA